MEIMRDTRPVLLLMEMFIEKVLHPRQIRFLYKATLAKTSKCRLHVATYHHTGLSFLLITSPYSSRRPLWCYWIKKKGICFFFLFFFTPSIDLPSSVKRCGLGSGISWYKEEEFGAQRDTACSKWGPTARVRDASLWHSTCVWPGSPGEPISLAMMTDPDSLHFRSLRALSI